MQRKRFSQNLFIGVDIFCQIKFLNKSLYTSLNGLLKDLIFGKYSHGSFVDALHTSYHSSRVKFSTGFFSELLIIEC